MRHGKLLAVTSNIRIIRPANDTDIPPPKKIEFTGLTLEIKDDEKKQTPDIRET